MSVLVEVRTALQSNPGVTIVEVREENHLPDIVMGWGHIVDFYVAPAEGGVYTAAGLQALMMALVPGLDPTSWDEFREFDGEIQFGKLYFDEDIGTETSRHELTLTDRDMFTSRGFVDGKQIISNTQEIRRRVFVRLFPNVQIVRAVLEGGVGAFSISASQLSRYR